jgi:hypothetical protein
LSKRGTEGDGSSVRSLKQLTLHATHSRQGFDGTVSKRERQNVLYIFDYIGAVDNLTNTVVSALTYLSVDKGITKSDNASNYHLIFKYLRSSASIIYFYFKNRSSDESSSMLPKSIPP